MLQLFDTDDEVIFSNVDGDDWPKAFNEAIKNGTVDLRKVDFKGYYITSDLDFSKADLSEANFDHVRLGYHHLRKRLPNFSINDNIRSILKAKSIKDCKLYLRRISDLSEDLQSEFVLRGGTIEQRSK